MHLTAPKLCFLCELSLRLNLQCPEINKSFLIGVIYQFADEIVLHLFPLHQCASCVLTF